MEDKEMEEEKKMRGRKPGSKNRLTAINKQIITDLLSDYSDSGLMLDDFMRLDPKDRILVSEKLMQYVMPKMQAVQADMTVANKQGVLADTLKNLSGTEENSE